MKTMHGLEPQAAISGAKVTFYYVCPSRAPARRMDFRPPCRRHAHVPGGAGGTPGLHAPCRHGCVHGGPRRVGWRRQTMPGWGPSRLPDMQQRGRGQRPDGVAGGGKPPERGPLPAASSMGSSRGPDHGARPGPSAPACLPVGGPAAPAAAKGWTANSAQSLRRRPSCGMGVRSGARNGTAETRRRWASRRRAVRAPVAPPERGSFISGWLAPSK